MGRKLLRLSVLVVYAGSLVVLFGITAYLSFNAFVQKGVTPVPDLVGLTLEQAEGLLADQGLRMRWVESEDRFDDAIDPGQVLQHDPGAGSLVKKNSVVEVVLSRGRRLVQVPDVRGQAVQAAQVNLGAAGLQLGRRSNIYSDRGEPGTVVGQSPLPEAQVDRATAVDLLVSLDNAAETFVMPNLIYLDDETVRAFFQHHGFRLGSVKYEPYEGIEAGVVLRQYPLAGHPLRRHDVISLVVAAQPESDTRESGRRLGG